MAPIRNHQCILDSLRGLPFPFFDDDVDDAADDHRRRSSRGEERDFRRLVRPNLRSETGRRSTLSFWAVGMNASFDDGVLGEAAVWFVKNGKLAIDTNW